MKFGVIGTGRFGKHYVRLLKEIHGVQLVATANRTTGPEIVLENPEIDCVIIATPVSTHFDICKKALEQGKHVLVEKPMVSSMEEARSLEYIVQKSGRIFMVGHQYLYNDYVRYLKKLLAEGLLGKIHYVFAEQLHCGMIRSDVGCFWECATHELAILDYLFGPLRILDVSGKLVDFRGIGREDFASVAITFDNGVSAAIVVSWFAPEKVRRMTLVGEKGMAVFDDCLPERKLKFVLCPYPQSGRKKSLFIELSKYQTIIPHSVMREPLQNQLEHFVSSVRNVDQPLTGIIHGVRITGYLETIMQNIR